jgi:hypothetical protein
MLQTFFRGSSAFTAAKSGLEFATFAGLPATRNLLPKRLLTVDAEVSRASRRSNSQAECAAPKPGADRRSSGRYCRFFAGLPRGAEGRSKLFLRASAFVGSTTCARCSGKQDRGNGVGRTLSSVSRIRSGIQLACRQRFVHFADSLLFAADSVQ